MPLTSSPASGANFAEITTTHVAIDWVVDFDTHKISGSVTHTLDVHKDGVDKVVLDTRALTISGVEDGLGGRLDFTEAPAPLPCFGKNMTVTLPAGLKSGMVTKVKISYSTSSTECSALQWMPKEQTAGRRGPYLFSQCQAIHARSLLPCMDTPAVKATYEARVTVPAELVALMSAVGQDAPLSEAAGQKTYGFTQKVPIPSYLIAIVVGVLERRVVSPRCAVWSEAELVDAAAKEFEDTEAMLAEAEKLMGPYVWGRYDILVLPPTFPFGGMENPCLTFATPTLLAGDKSLANVIQHEITHSWCGNLVTNATWDHFWLNEGFTTFCERKATGILLHKKNPAYSAEAYRQASAIEGWNNLRYAVEEQFGPTHKFTAMRWDTTGVDPDEAFSVVPYEKGHAFLFYLEGLVGGPAAFDPWLRSYLADFAFKSVTTEEWKAHFLAAFPGVDFSGVDWDAWFNKPGMPDFRPNYDASLYAAGAALATAWLGGAVPDSAADYEAFTSAQKVNFLSKLIEAEPGTLSPETLVKLESLYGLGSTKNCEVRLRWFRIALKQHFEPAIPAALDFVTEQGRMKFTRPVYKALCGWAVSRPQAVARFERQRKFMHPLTASLVAKDMKAQQG